MSKLPRPVAPLRVFEYVTEADEASMRVRLQQHLGHTGMIAFGHVVDAVRVLCERSLLPPMTVLDELLPKISPKAKLPEVINRLKCLTAPSSTPQISFHQAVRAHLMKALPLLSATPAQDAMPTAKCDSIPAKHVPNETMESRSQGASQSSETPDLPSYARDPKRARCSELVDSARSRFTSCTAGCSTGGNGAPVAAAKQTVAERPIILLPQNLETAVLNIANGKTFFQDGVFVPSGNNNPLSPKITASPCPAECIVHFDGNEYELKEMTACTLEDWLKRVVAVVIQGNTWQFKDFHSKDPVQIFATVKGFYVQYSESPCAPCVSAWNVQVVRIGRCSRHLDSAAQRQMWQSIADHARRRRLI